VQHDDIIRLEASELRTTLYQILAAAALCSVQVHLA